MLAHSRADARPERKMMNIADRIEMEAVIRNPRDQREELFSEYVATLKTETYLYEDKLIREVGKALDLALTRIHDDVTERLGDLRFELSEIIMEVAP